MALPLLILPLALVGFWDDRLNLPAGVRYGVQLLTALILILLSPLPYPLFLIPILMLGITAIINFVNFMDGLDGLVAGCIAVAIAAEAIVLRSGFMPWALVGALMGFLLWNWSPAKVFMGDVGSTFLGAFFAGLLLQAPNWRQALGLLMVLLPLFADSASCVIRRMLAGHHIFQAHRLHLFQRLHQAGWPHSRVSLTYIAATLILALSLLLGGLLPVFFSSSIILLLGIWLDRAVALPFSKALQS